MDIRIDNIINCCGNIKKMMQKRLNNFFKTYDLTSIHAPYLLLLKNSRGLTMKEINQCLGVDKSNTTRVIKSLENKKLVFKTDDKKKCKVYLTDKGIETAQLIEERLMILKKEIMNNINNEQLDNFINALKQIEDSLRGE